MVYAPNPQIFIFLSLERNWDIKCLFLYLLNVEKFDSYFLSGRVTFYSEFQLIKLTRQETK